MQKIKNNELKRLKGQCFSPEKIRKIIGDKTQENIKSAVNMQELLRRPYIQYSDIVALIGPANGVDAEMVHRIETEIKYEGYINRQLRQIEQMRKRESVEIPETINYQELNSLRLEAREKLAKIRPKTLGQASRIPGVSPSDVSQLAIAMDVIRKKQAKPEDDY